MNRDMEEKGILLRELSCRTAAELPVPDFGGRSAPRVQTFFIVCMRVGALERDPNNTQNPRKSVVFIIFPHSGFLLHDVPVLQ
jgi:hypothetical protein